MNKLDNKKSFAIGYILATVMAFGGYGVTGQQGMVAMQWVSNISADKGFWR